MEKLLKLISGLLIALSAFLVGLKLTQPISAPVYGASQPLGEIVSTASSTRTYFGQNGADANGISIRTATTTLLTLFQNQQWNNVALQISDVATTSAGICVNSCAATIYVQPQISFDAGTWSDWNPPVRSTNGTQVGTITLGNASSTVLIWTPTTSGTTTTLFNFERMPGKYARFLVWSTGTSTVLLTGFQQN